MQKPEPGDTTPPPTSTSASASETGTIVVDLVPDEVHMVTPSPTRTSSRFRAGGNIADAGAGSAPGAGVGDGSHAFDIPQAQFPAAALTSSLSPAFFTMEGSSEAKDPLFMNTPSKDGGMVPLNLDTRFSPNTPVNLLRFTPISSAKKQGQTIVNTDVAQQHQLAAPPAQPDFVEHLTPATTNEQTVQEGQTIPTIEALVTGAAVTSAPAQLQGSQALPQPDKPYSRFVPNAHLSQETTSSAMPTVTSQLPPGATTHVQTSLNPQLNLQQLQAQAAQATQALAHHRNAIDREMSKMQMQRPRVEVAPGYHLQRQVAASAQQMEMHRRDFVKYYNQQWFPGSTNGLLRNDMPAAAQTSRTNGVGSDAAVSAGSLSVHQNQPIAPMHPTSMHPARVQASKKSGTSKRSRAKGAPKPQPKKYSPEEATRIAAAMDRPPTRKSSKGGWTSVEDDMLRVIVMENNERNWKNIAKALNESFPGGTRTDVQCLHRWQKVLQPGLKKGPWTAQEDATICELVNKLGANKWTSIANQLQGRIGKQCRERWFNHLKPDIKKEPWSAEEEAILVKQHAIHGNKWALIATHLPGRTDNAIKNHYNATQRRAANKKLGRKTKKRTSDSNPSSAPSSQDPAMGNTAASAPRLPKNTQSRNLDVSNGSIGNATQVPAPVVTSLAQNIPLAGIAVSGLNLINPQGNTHNQNDNIALNAQEPEIAPAQPRKRRKSNVNNDMVGNTSSQVPAQSQPSVHSQQQQPMQVEPVQLDVQPMLGNSVYDEVDKENALGVPGGCSTGATGNGSGEIALATPLRERSMNVELGSGHIRGTNLFSTPRASTVRKPRVNGTGSGIGNDTLGSAGKNIFPNDVLDASLPVGSFSTPPRDLSRNGSASRAMALGHYLTPLNGKSPGSMFLNMSPMQGPSGLGLTPNSAMPPFGMLFSSASARKDGSLPPMFVSPGPKGDDTNPFGFSPSSRRWLNFENSAAPASRTASRLHTESSEVAGISSSDVAATAATGSVTNDSTTGTLEQALDQAESDK